jgi:DnaJ-class molecular chaperone
LKERDVNASYARDHPDKNHGDASATQRFQKLGQAWDICQKHYENPARSYVPERGAGIWGPDDDDDDYDMRGSFDPDMMDFFRCV